MSVTNVVRHCLGPLMQLQGIMPIVTEDSSSHNIWTLISLIRQRLRLRNLTKVTVVFAACFWYHISEGITVALAWVR